MHFRGVTSPEMLVLRRYSGIVAALVCFGAFQATVNTLYARPRPVVAVEMQVALPRFVEVLMAAGDRYLAANMLVFRALVASTGNMGPDNYHIQGLLQTDAAWLNPAHEDNYYIAAAILPWSGELAAAQTVLRAATDARPFDWQPPFYLGFNLLHFLKQPTEGADWLRVAARHTTDQMQALQLQQLAANWLAKGEDVQLAVRIHRAMARETKYKAFAEFLEKRATRLENLVLLDSAIARYRQRFGSAPQLLGQLVDRGIISALPVDPFASSYRVDASGRAQAADPRAQGEESRSKH